MPSFQTVSCAESLRSCSLSVRDRDYFNSTGVVLKVVRFGYRFFLHLFLFWCFLVCYSHNYQGVFNYNFSVLFQFRAGGYFCEFSWKEINIVKLNCQKKNTHYCPLVRHNKTLKAQLSSNSSVDAVSSCSRVWGGFKGEVRIGSGNWDDKPSILLNHHVPPMVHGDIYTCLFIKPDSGLYLSESNRTDQPDQRDEVW